MKVPTKVFTTALLLTSALVAQDVSGRWVGTADTTDEVQVKRQEKHTFDIKTVDGKLDGSQVGRTGTGTPVGVQQDGAKVNIYRFLPLDGGEHLHWKLELKEGKLVGMYYVTHDNPKKWQFDRTGAITLTTAPAADAAPAAK